MQINRFMESRCEDLPYLRNYYHIIQKYKKLWMCRPPTKTYDTLSKYENALETKTTVQGFKLSEIVICSYILGESIDFKDLIKSLKVPKNDVNNYDIEQDKKLLKESIKTLLDDLVAGIMTSEEPIIAFIKHEHNVDIIEYLKICMQKIK